MYFSNHSIKRMQQRGFSFDTVKTILFECDMERHVGDGRLEMAISKKKVAKLCNERRYPISEIEKAKNVSLIVFEGQVVTVFHKTKKKKYH